MGEGHGSQNSGSERNLFKRKGTWYARVKVNGDDRRRSLHTGVKAVALKKLRRILDDADAERHGEQGERRAWKAAVVEWSAHMVGAIKPSVLDRYKFSLGNCRPILDPLDVEEIDTKVIARLVQYRKDEGVTNATIRRDLTAVSSVLQFCRSKGWLETNAAKNYDRSMIRERRDPIVLPAAADIDAVVAMTPGNFAWAIRYAQYTGMRQMEVFTLETRSVRGDVTDLWKTKTDTPRAVPNDERARGALEGPKKNPDSRWVFWHGDPPRPYKNVASRFGAIMRRAVRDKKVKRRFAFHDLRHWFAVDFLRSGGNIYALQQILGHSSITTTEIYLRFLTPEEQQRAKYGSGGTNAAQ